MDKKLSYLLYSPPKSNSLGHSVRDRDVNRGLKKIVDSFIENFGATQFGELQVTLYYDNKKDNQTQIDNSISSFKTFLGIPLWVWENTGYPDQRSCVTWKTMDKNIFEIQDYYSKNKIDLLPLENFWFSSFYTYGNGETIHGSVMCSVEFGKLFARLHLIFPYSIDDPRLFPLVNNLYKQLPFKLSSKHFKRLIPGKSGHRTLRLDEELQKQIDACLK